ncbi:uncharacterized protein F4812DRAFT_164278 [Daldinia caldariorum]|uniref:uncharacterized protein n=1 Tax=Daldinia caldariorum TaxID=326644 RepID=UPI002008A414|nr:uncharacterized protein F4812DRAFT_164278 [Daldinia caldariorum]KAI1471037.1 hypothetical protein F4812DRAFT_164278 [Daldinia caldariorum]
MSNVDVVQRTAAALPSPFESAMAAAAAAATATTAGVGVGVGTGSGTGTVNTTPSSATVAMASNKPATTTSSPPTSIAAATSTTTTTTTTTATTAPQKSSGIGKISFPPQIGVIGIKRTRNGDHKEGRNSKSRQRPFTKSMEPPVLSFYGTQPVPLPSRFGSLKKRLVAGHESALEASWGRLLAALRDEITYIEEHGSGLIPSIDFADMDDAAKVAPFGAQLKRHGIGVIKGVVPSADASAWVAETKKYLETKHEYKPPPAQDPTCFDFFWTPAQVRSRAHPHVLQAQRFAMSLWNANNDDRLATRFPITYADRIRIESVSNGHLTVNGALAPTHEDSLIAAAAATSSAQIAQIDNGSLERWEQDGYGRGGLYDAVFRGDWESYDAWDPAGRINATSDLYNGAGACSMLRLFQGILALTVVEPGMIRLLPSPKLSTAYFLLRPFFSPKKGPPPQGAGEKEWNAYLDASNWALDKEQSTIIHGAVPGHAQRVTAAWHPHLQLDKSLVTPPTLQAGDYIIWHPDQAYQFSNTNYRSTSRPQTSSSEPGAGDTTSMLVYTPAAPLTQTNALFLARQRKAFLRGHPGPDFDSTGTGLGSEAPHTGRLGEKEIREVGGEEGLQAMGLAPWNLSSGSSSKGSSSNSSNNNNNNNHKHRATAAAEAAAAPKRNAEGEMDVDAPSRSSSRDSRSSSTSSSTHAEAEVVRLANIILFPDRYDFYMPTRASSPAPAVGRGSGGGDRGEKERERERERDRSNRERENSDRDKDRDKGKDREK